MGLGEGADENKMVEEKSPEKSEKSENQNGDGVLEKRPESATSAEISSLTVDGNSVDQSPARSPHARSWTVPGVLSYKICNFCNHLQLLQLFAD